MFNPLLNADGSLAKFRLYCSLFLILAMLASAIYLLAESSQSELLEEYPEPTVDPEQMTFSQLNTLAVEELYAAINYYNGCGLVNKGYVGCNYKFSDLIEDNYAIEQEANDDGFFVSLSAKSNLNQECAQLTYKSFGQIEGLDEQQQINDKCTFNFSDDVSMLATRVNK